MERKMQLEKEKIISDLHVINPYSLGGKRFEDLTPEHVYDHLTNLSKINVNLQAVVVLRTQNIFLINQLNRGQHRIRII